MKRSYLLAVGLAVTLGIGLLSARTWTSADGTKKFEGVLRAYDKKTGKVTVTMQSGRPFTLDVAILYCKTQRQVLDLLSQNLSVILLTQQSQSNLR